MDHLKIARSMTKIAIIRTGGKQYKVREGQVLKVEKINKKEKELIKLETLLVSSVDAKNVEIGRPSLGNTTVAEIIEQARDKRISVIKYKNKTRYLRNKGHRQSFSKLKIKTI